MESEQRLKRKRAYRPYSRVQLLFLRSFILRLSFFVFLMFLSSERFPIRTVSFHPVLTVPNLSILSKNSLRDSINGKLRLPLRVEDRVLFPDHLLLLVSDKIHEDDKLDCVYHKALNDKDIVRRRVLSVDEFDGFRLVVRCPNPPWNYSAAVGLVWTGDVVDDFGWSFRRLNLRPHKESDPTKFMCQFGLKKMDDEEDGGLVVMTEAILAAQEVVRCTLPRSTRNNLDSTQGIRVTIVHDPMPSTVRIRNSRSYERGRNQIRHKENVAMPSVAKLYNPMPYQGKYELCACTMLWNQAPALREWIMYHAWLGVERWFIYDNNSDDGIQEVIEELDFQDYNVSRHTWPWIKTQEAGFSHCALRARNECKWVGFFDVDEFYYFPHHHRSGLQGQNLLRSLVANYSLSSTIAEIRTACHSFGPSGLSSTPSKGVTVWETFRAKFFRRVATYVVDWQENQNQGSKDRAPGLETEAIEPPNWRKQFCEVRDTGLRDFVLANLADPATGSLTWEKPLL
ncbi:UPF0392 protein [Hibiscus syriacus]|uniref:Glycosyltransferase family 92 protein n=1 Tax=Hibiscus syriacus TaxID=106335 RepID=A0A6A2WCR7_HIBSY|nr:UPF0392 protein [Hibiscus syriacus]